MIDFDDDLSIDIADGVSTNDLLKNPDKHYWKVSFKFPNNRSRNASATPTGKKYGRSIPFGVLYKALRAPFIEEYFDYDYYDSWVKEVGDSLLSELNEEIGVTVNKLKSATDEVYAMSRNARINRKRSDNATVRFEDFREKYAEERQLLEVLEDTVPLTKKGNYDRRTRAYHKYKAELSKIKGMEARLSKLERRALSEQIRFENSLEREEKAVTNVRRIRSGEWSSLKDKYKEKAKRYANSVKEDIIDRGMDGRLPIQNLPLKESTIRKRLGVGLSAGPRYWATGQLIKSIRITCTIV